MVAWFHGFWSFIIGVKRFFQWSLKAGASRVGSEAGPVLQLMLVLFSDQFLATFPTPVHFALASCYLVSQNLPTMWTNSLLIERILRVRQVLTNQAVQDLLPVTKTLSISYRTFTNCRNFVVFVFPTFFLLS